MPERTLASGCRVQCQRKCLALCCQPQRVRHSSLAPHAPGLCELPHVHMLRMLQNATVANFPPSARGLYLHAEASSPLDSARHPSPCLSSGVLNVNSQPAGVENDPRRPC